MAKTKSDAFFYNGSWYHRTKFFRDDNSVGYSKKGGFKSAQEARESYKRMLNNFEKQKHGLYPSSRGDSLGHAKTIISVDVYGDMKKIIEDCSSDMDSFIAEILPEEVLFERPINNVYTDEQSFLSNTLLKRMLGGKLYGFLLAK